MIFIVSFYLNYKMQGYGYEETDEINGEESEGVTECDHSQINHIDGMTICVGCGVKIDEDLVDNENRYYGSMDTRYGSDPSRYNQRKCEERNLYSDMDPLGFPQDVIERANVYYKKIIDNKIYRAGNRMSIVFACTYHAYMDIQEPRPPSELAAIFNIDKKGISNGLKTFSHIFRKRPDKKYIEAMDLVPKILVALQLDNNTITIYKKDLEYLYNWLKTKSKNYNSGNPQTIAAGMVYYYLKLLNTGIARSDYAKIVKLSDITFIKISQDIHRLVQPQIQHVIKF